MRQLNKFPEGTIATRNLMGFGGYVPVKGSIVRGCDNFSVARHDFCDTMPALKHFYKSVKGVKSYLNSKEKVHAPQE